MVQLHEVSRANKAVDGSAIERTSAYGSGGNCIDRGDIGNVNVNPTVQHHTSDC